MKRAARRALVVVGAMLSLLTTSGPSGAYCLASSCEDGFVGTLCTPSEPEDCGVPLRWATGCTGFTVEERGSAAVPGDLAHELVETAFYAYTSVDCGGAPPGLFVHDMGRVPCNRAEYNQSAGNANIVIFHDQTWPHPAGAHNLALTTLTFDTATGALLDADIEINGVDSRLTTGDDDVEHDVLSILVHEAGHFLGLGHSRDPNATMWAIYEPGETFMRELDSDDIAAICAAYPPRSVDERCNPLPRRGFSPECSGAQREGDCAVGRLGAPRERGSGLALGLVVALAFVARSRRSPKADFSKG